MKIFKLDEEYSVVCVWKKTRMAFKHEAVITRNGNQIYKTKICYQNRTWERYEYQSVLHKAINGYFEKDVAGKFSALADGKGGKDVSDKFGMIAGIAKLGDILCDNQKDKNDWKMRMLKAGIRGIDPPEDWDSLPEDEKQRRLDGAIAVLK